MAYPPNFYTWKKARRYAKESCFCFKDTNKYRQTLVKIVTSPCFENFILVCVLLNTVFMMIPNYDYNFVDPVSLEPLSKAEHGCCPLYGELPPKCINGTADNNKPCLTMSCSMARVSNGEMCCPCPRVNMVAFSSELEWTFLVIFLIEMLLKMVAFGVLPGPSSWQGSYLTDGWNVLDFVIVISALASAPYPGSESSPSFSFIRVIRVLRPLRSLSIIPSMRRMVQTLIISIKQLTALAMLLCFIFLIFGALMIQIYAGELRYTCRLTNFPLQLPIMSMNSSNYHSGGVNWVDAKEVNWCTYRDDWEKDGFWSGIFPSCDWNENLYTNTRTSTMHDQVFYHKLEYYPTAKAGQFKTQYFYFNTTSAWHRFHRELMANASSASKDTTDPYELSALHYQTDLLNAAGIFKPCQDDQGITIPISFEQCNRICYNSQVDEQSRKYSVCDNDPSSTKCKLWIDRNFDKYDRDHPMCAKYCPNNGSTMSKSWDVQSLASPNAGLNSPWRNVSAETFPFYTDLKYCFWPNDHDSGSRTSGRLCSGWFTSVYDGAQGHNKCPADQYCGSDFDPTGNLRFHGHDIVNAGVYKEDLLWGIPQFNNFAQAFVSILQSITLEGWVDILYTVSQ